MDKLEKDTERLLVRRVEQAGGQCLKWVCPGRSGVPDRIVLLPGGRIAFVELKRPKGGRVSELQKYWANKLEAAGFKWYLLKDGDDVRKFMEGMNG